MFQQRNVHYRLDGWPAKRSWLVIRYFEWQNRFFYRRLHLNAKYYSNGTGFLHPFALSQRLLFLSLIGLSCSLYLLPLTLSLSLSLSLFTRPRFILFVLTPSLIFLFPSRFVHAIRYSLPNVSPLSRRWDGSHAAETPLGQEASFPDIQMRSNIIPGHRVPHRGATPRFPRG